MSSDPLKLLIVYATSNSKKVKETIPDIWQGFPVSVKKTSKPSLAEKRLSLR